MRHSNWRADARSSADTDWFCLSSWVRRKSRSCEIKVGGQKLRDDVRIRAPHGSLSSMNGDWWTIQKADILRLDCLSISIWNQFPLKKRYPKHKAVSIGPSFLLCCLVVFQFGSIRYWKLPVVAGAAKQQRQSVAAARTPETLHQRECV